MATLRITELKAITFEGGGLQIVADDELRGEVTINFSEDDARWIAAFVTDHYRPHYDE